MNEFETLKQEVTETNGVILSAIALITGLGDLLRAALAKPTVDEFRADVMALSQSLDSSQHSLAEAITANPLPAEAPSTGDTSAETGTGEAPTQTDPATGETAVA